MIDGDEHICEVCSKPAYITTLGELHMHRYCAACFPRMDEWTAQINANIKTFKLDWKTARFVASALDEWLANKITQLNALGEADDPDGWDWNDIPIISGAIKIIRSSEDHTP